MEQIEGHSGDQTTSNYMLHDLECEYIVKNISKEDAQALLEDLPENYYVTDKYYDSVKRRLEFVIMLDNVAPLEISEHYDYMEINHPECRRRLHQLHDFQTSFSDEEAEDYSNDAIDLSQFVDRTLP